MASPYFSGTKMARTIRFLRAHKRVILFSLVFAWAAFRLMHPGDLGLSGALFVVGINLLFIASQLFWIRRVRELGVKLIASKRWRKGLGTAGLIVYFFVIPYNLLNFENVSKGSDLTLRAALLEAPGRLWLFGSLLGFLVVILLWIADRVARAVSWAFKKLIISHTPKAHSPSRRLFLEQTAFALSAAPFVAGGYGLFYGRLNLETTYRRIKLRRLPKAFEGFRIVQLSDFHVSTFMSAEEIRKYVAIANQLKGDLVALTGDYVTWDETAQGAVVEALSNLKAPFGVFGCLGNHEWVTETEDSITRLFAARGIRILRGDHAAVSSEGSTLNLLGVDYQSRRGRLEASGNEVEKYLLGMERLLLPNTVNILLSHNPNTFDRAAELGIDLSLGGHTHGGQVAWEFIHRSLAPARLITPYVRGWFQKGDAQLYVNRGIGTVSFPIRCGARPEITVLELVRAV
jgi:predicted MPP superfamily phosphohydrolase